MNINNQESPRILDQLRNIELGGTLSAFTVINPHFFNFLRDSSGEYEATQPLPGVTIEWSPNHRLPQVYIEDFSINPDGQLFYQMYGDQLVEVEI